VQKYIVAVLTLYVQHTSLGFLSWHVNGDLFVATQVDWMCIVLLE